MPPLRRDRSRRGRGPTGRTRARTLASTRTRPKRPVLGSDTTITSASPTATPSWSSACSVASSTVLPATSTHSTRYRAFLVRFERDRGWDLGAGASSTSSLAALPFVVRFPAGGFFPFVGAAAVGLRAVLGRRQVALAAAVPSVAVDVFLVGFGGGFGGGLSSLAEPISRSATTGVTIPVRNITSWVPIRMADDTTM